MKKLLFLLSVILLSSCTCIMSQVPDQYLYVDQSCGAALPDYLLKVTATDNCAIDTIWQSPTRGTWLTQPATTVLIRAIDNFGNHTDLMFTVHLLDTVPPKITADTTMLVNAYGHIDNLYNTAERMLARQVWFEESTAPDSLMADGDFMNDYLVCYTAPGKAWGLDGFRVWTFAKPGTTITFPVE